MLTTCHPVWQLWQFRLLLLMYILGIELHGQWCGLHGGDSTAVCHTGGLVMLSSKQSAVLRASRTAMSLCSCIRPCKEALLASDSLRLVHLGCCLKKKSLFAYRRRDTSRIHSIAALPPPPLPTEPEMLFANPVSLATITQQSRESSAMPSLDFSSCCARIGRGGRLIMSRCQPFTYEPLDVPQPVEEQQKMPFDLTAPYLAAAHAARQVQIRLAASGNISEAIW